MALMPVLAHASLASMTGLYVYPTQIGFSYVHSVVRTKDSFRALNNGRIITNNSASHCALPVNVSDFLQAVLF